MVKPYWWKLAFAIFGLCLFMGDTGSDLYIGYDLWNRCHHFYATALLTFMIMPGFIMGFYFFVFEFVFKEHKDSGPMKISLLLVFGVPLAASLAGILFIPYGIFMMISSVMKVDSSDREKDVRM